MDRIPVIESDTQKSTWQQKSNADEKRKHLWDQKYNQKLQKWA